jgi:hypothetical protein
VCLDETSKQLVSETRVPIPAEPGQVERYDYEYERQGVCSLFMCFEPLTGWRHVTVSTHRTKQDFAQVLRDLVGVYYPEAEKIVLVLNNLNTHDHTWPEVGRHIPARTIGGPLRLSGHTQAREAEVSMMCGSWNDYESDISKHTNFV